MFPVVAQLPARTLAGEQILILGFDPTHAFCVKADGSLNYVDMALIRVDWTYDQTAGIWTSSTSTLEDLLEEVADAEAEEGTAPTTVDDGVSES